MNVDERLEAETWMLEQVALNPGYTGWRPGADYMRGPGSGWDSSWTVPTWADLNLTLDDLNEVVNFYFEVARASHDCAHCRGEGVNPRAQSLRGPPETPAERALLATAGRWPPGPLGGDSISKWLVMRARCKERGIDPECEHCAGHGGHYTGAAHLRLVLWVIHPRKGASRGMVIERIEQADIPAVHAFLRQAAERSRVRFDLTTPVQVASTPSEL